MKTCTGTFFLFSLALILLFGTVWIQAQGRTLYALQSRRGNEGVSVVINVNINPHKAKSSAATIPMDETTKKVVESFKEAVSQKEELEIKEKYLDFANKIKNIVDQIDQVNTTPEAKDVKEVLLTIVKDLTLKSEHPSADLLKSSLSDISHLNENQPLKDETTSQQQTTTPSSSSDAPAQPISKVSMEETAAKSLWITSAISLTSLGMNIVDGIGTYSDKLSKVGKFVSGPVADKLDKWGLKGVAAKAKSAGSSIDSFSQNKMKPLETKIAKKIAPVVKSKTFQAVRRTLNVVSGAISIKGGLNALGLAKNLKLPSSYKALKTSLTKATKFVKNRKQVMSAVRTVGKTAAKNWKKASGIGKLKTLNNFRAGYSGLKTGLSTKRYSNPSTKKNSNRQQQGKKGANSKSGRANRGGASRKQTGRSGSTSGARKSSGGSSRSSGSSRKSSGGSSSRKSTSSGRSSSSAKRPVRKGK